MDIIDTIVTGGCQCGAVRYRASQMLDNAHICHCRMCQKAVGHVFVCLVAAPKDKIKWTRGKPSVWRSSEHVERGFCENCGTPLFYNDVNNNRTNFTMGSLDNAAQFPPKDQWGEEGKVAWFDTLAEIRHGGATDDGDAKDWADAIQATNNQHPDHDTENWVIKP